MTDKIKIFKNQAKILKEYLHEGGFKISHSACLIAISKIHGFKDFNTLNGVVKKYEGK
jgi:hypothetical protein